MVVGMEPELSNTKLTEQIDDLQKRAAALVEKGEKAADPAEIGEVKSQLAKLTDEMAPLQEAYVSNMREQAMRDMKGQLTTLNDAVAELRGTAPAPVGEQKSAAGLYGPAGSNSFFADVAKALTKSDQKAFSRLEEGSKAMVESDDSQGGFLVPEETLGGLGELKDQASVVRGLVNVVSVSGDSVRFIQQNSGLLAGWVAELAEKPLADMTFGEVSASVFTAAGMSVAANQLLADAKWSVDQLIYTDIAKRLNTVEEVAIINGSGTGQPRGILQTPGVDKLKLTSTAVPDLLDKVVDGIAEVYAEHLMAPTAILLHPLTWARIIKAREATSPSTYLVGPGSSAWGRRANDPIPGLGAGPAPVGELFGVPVYCSANVPTTLGTNQNETCVIVGDFSEALILDRQGVTTDASEHVFFTSNQTIFRAEMRMGFTAARDPKAFKVIGGAGLKV